MLLCRCRASELPGCWPSRMPSSEDPRGSSSGSVLQQPRGSSPDEEALATATALLMLGPHGSPAAMASSRVGKGWEDLQVGAEVGREGLTAFGSVLLLL